MLTLCSGSIISIFVGLFLAHLSAARIILACQNVVLPFRLPITGGRIEEKKREKEIEMIRHFLSLLLLLLLMVMMIMARKDSSWFRGRQARRETRRTDSTL